MTIIERVSLIFVAGAIVSCEHASLGGHGPPEKDAGLGDYGTPPGGSVTIALRSFEVARPAIGLSAFPDGGIGIPLDAGVEVNVCEKSTGRFRQIAVIHEHPTPDAGYGTPAIVAWLDTAVKVTHYSGPVLPQGDTIVPLPPEIRVGTAPRTPLERSVLPECEAALTTLRNSRTMPDGSPVTPDSLYK